MYDTYVLHEVTAIAIANECDAMQDASNDGQSCVLHCNAVNRRAVTKRTDKIPLGLEYRI